MKLKMSCLSALIVSLIFLSSCTKDVPQELQTDGSTPSDPHSMMPDDTIHNNMRQGFEHAPDSNAENTEDEKKANYLMKEADDADGVYMKTKSKSDKKIAIEKHLEAANFIMLEANLTPRKKYRPAYKRYKRVLELDAENEEATHNKVLIEDIYSQMGMEVPSDE